MLIPVCFPRSAEQARHLRASLAAVQAERDAMKDTFEEDLAHLHRQLIDMERARARLERHLVVIKRNHPHVIDELDADDEDDSSGSSAAAVIDSMPSSTDISANHSPSHRGPRLMRSPDLFAMLQQQVAAVGGGEGIFSDSVQLEQRMRRVLQVPSAFTTDSIQATTTSTVELEILQGQGQTEGLPGFTTNSGTSPPVATTLSPTPADTSEVVCAKYEQRLAQLVQQHSMELRIQEFSQMERSNGEMKRLRASIEAELERDYGQRQQELDQMLRQRIHALEAEKQHEFIEQLQKVRGRAAVVVNLC